MNEILRVLGRVRSRMTLQRALTRAFALAVAGSAALAAASVAYRLSGDLRWLAGGLVGLAASLLAGAAWGLAERPSIIAAAIAADGRLGLKERLTTMVEATLRRSEGDFVEAQRADAVRAAMGRDFSGVRRVSVPDRARYAAALAIVAVGIAAMPSGSRNDGSPRSALAAAIAAAGGSVGSNVSAVKPEDVGRDAYIELREVADEAGRDIERSSSAAEADEALRALDEHVSRIMKERAEAGRLEALRSAIARARRSLEAASPEGGMAGGMARGGAADPVMPVPGVTAAEGGGPLASPKALAEAARRYPEYAGVLMRYFAEKGKGS